MAANTLFGKLYSAAEVEHEKTINALNTNAKMVNQFGEAIAPFELIPHIRAGDNGKISFAARTERGRNNEALFAALVMEGFHIGKSDRASYQFTDGWIMWTTPISGHKLEFCLLTYTKVEAA